MRTTQISRGFIRFVFGNLLLITLLSLSACGGSSIDNPGAIDGEPPSNSGNSSSSSSSNSSSSGSSNSSSSGSTSTSSSSSSGMASTSSSSGGSSNSSSSSSGSSSSSNSSSSSSSSGGDTGAVLYSKSLEGSGSCASCHGDQGQGVNGRGGEIVNCGANCDSLSALESKISSTMPAGNAAACRDDCAKKVAEYIWTDLMGKKVENLCESGIQKTSPIRRLNKTEIANVFEDVFGSGHSEILAKLDDETEVVGGFATVGSALSTSRDWSNNYMQALIDAVDTLVDSGTFTANCQFAGTPPAPAPALPADQCDTTQQCKNIFGNQATDCANSQSDMSVCMCGNQECQADNSAETAQCFAADIKYLGELLYRRPLSEQEFMRLDALKQGASSNAEGLKAALLSMFSSANFLFSLTEDDRSQARMLSGNEMAMRLSLALWGSIPDKPLLDAAEAGRLSGASLEMEINRMMDDARFERFVELFVVPWLGLDGYLIEGSDVGRSDAEWDQLLADMKRETLSFLRHIITNNLPIDEIYTADYSFLNARLASFYGVASNSDNNTFAKTTLPASSGRRGLMTQAAVLAKAFDGTKTSVVKRGVIPLEAFTCTAPEPPNDESISSQVDMQAMGNQSEKEKITARAGSPICSGCHAVIDPVGWVFTEFGFAGEKVNLDPDGDPLSTGGNVHGQNFSSARDMMDILAAEKDFSPCFSTKFLIHALGRRVSRQSSEDQCAIDDSIKEVEVDGKVGAKDLIKSLLMNDIATFSGTIVE